ncbi:ABC transporter permease [Rhodococcus pseudokoreensis]|uniref:ABC transporter permease n=1 Tax=Rhodococcus pseudokoreensis TaxID=2811421 RepID=A0A974ZYP9_9NOCA|nr:ABC transporter permease [Rhodococcus pseudokoreensis]QSE94857.1 ABC transporter permease [Rhodococcus pseudokoreensis]
MGRYILAKLGQSLFVVWAAYSLTFVLLYVLPYDTVDLMFDPSEAELVSDADKDAARAHYGLDQPVVVQYATRLFGALHGDFGHSVRTGENVWSMIFAVLPQTAILAGAALLLAVIVAFVIALSAAYTRSSWLSQAIASLPAAGVSVPVFLVGLAILQVFSFQLRWFPPIGNNGFASLVLPAVTLAIPVSAPIAQLLLKNIELGLNAPYVTVSVAKGASRLWVLVRDVLKNASLPALTIAGLTLGNLLAGAVIVETIFSRSGLGRLTETAVRTQDVMLVQAVVVFAAIVFVVVNFVVDIVYPLLDPRLRTRVLAGAAPAAG